MTPNDEAQAGVGAARLTPTGGEPKDVCANCGHHEMNHANYADRCRACNQTGCHCTDYEAAPATPVASHESYSEALVRDLSAQLATAKAKGEAEGLRKAADAVKGQRMTLHEGLLATRASEPLSAAQSIAWSYSRGNSDAENAILSLLPDPSKEGGDGRAS